MALDKMISQNPDTEVQVPFISLELEERFIARSEPNSRSSSIKYKSRTKQLTLLDDDKRRNSLPITTEKAISGKSGEVTDKKPQQIRRVRSFRTTTKGLKNDIEDEHRNSNGSIYSTWSQKEMFRKRISSDTSDDSAICSGCSSTSSTGYYRVCVMGGDSVGKTTLTNQFMTSEFLSTNDLDGEGTDEVTVSVVIDKEETTLEFVDFSKNQETIEQCSFDAFIVVFSVHERCSFDVAIRYISYLKNEMYTDRTIILVANKVDLVRKRQVTSEEAKKVALDYNCKYTETSAAFNLKVDELLVGLLKQIKIKLTSDVNDVALNEISKNDGKKSKGPKGLLSKLFKRKPKASDDLLDIN